MLLLQNDDLRRLEIIDCKNATHYCFYCNKLFAIPYRVSKRGKITLGCYLANVGERHLKRCKSGGKEAIDHLVRKEQQNSRKRKVNMITKIENVKMYNGK